jgi:hypothetical protein
VETDSVIIGNFSAEEKLCALMLLYESVKTRLNMPFDNFTQSLKDWSVVPLKQQGKIIGAVIAKENELHIGYGEKPTASILRHLRDTLVKTINTFGFAITVVDSKNEKGLTFCQRLGFVKTKVDGGLVYLKCTRCNYA